MATLIDHKRRTLTRGSVDNLTGLMVTAMVSTPHARRLARNGKSAAIRYATVSVTAAIRRGGRTDMGQELSMNDAEREAWEAAHPIPA